MTEAAGAEPDRLGTALSAWVAGRADCSGQLSADRAWYAVLARPHHPAGRDLELVPTPGRLQFYGPGDRTWWDRRLERVVSMAWAPGASLATGLLADPADGALRLWVADPARATVSVAGAPASVAPPPVWAGPGKAVFGAPVGGDPPARAPWVFESVPGAHVRVLPPGGRPVPVRLMAYDAAAGTTEELGVPPAAVGRLAATDGWVAIIKTEDQGELTVAPLGDERGAGDAPAPCVHPLDGWVQGLCWSSASGTPRLVAIVRVGEDVELRSLDPGEGNWHTLWRERGAVTELHEAPQTGTLALLVEQPAGRVLLTITGAGVQANALADPSDASTGPAQPGTIVQLETEQGCTRLALAGFAARPDQPRPLTLFATAPGDPAGTLRAIHDLALEPGQLLREVTDWDRRVLRCHRHDAEVPPLRWAAPARVGNLEDAHVVVHPSSPTASTPGRGTLVWIQPGEVSMESADMPIPEAVGPSSGDSPLWHTQHGYSVVKLRLPLGWWADTPDADLRPRVVESLVAALSRPELSGELAPRPWTVGGLSFGATLALLLLADTDLMTAGIVRSGAYSRQLTMLGFQHEHRTLWQAPIVYREFDAILHADQIRQPVLISHGLADGNPATPFQQSCLLYQALTANGTPCRLVLLPHDGHAYRSLEGLTTVLGEEAAWLHRWT